MPNFTEYFAELERRKKEQSEKANNDPRGVIFTDGFHPEPTTADVVKFATDGTGWRNLLDVAREQAAAAAYERKHRHDIIPTPEPEFDPED